MVRLVALAALCGVLTQATSMACGHACHAAQSASAATSQHPCHASPESDGADGAVDRLAPAPVSCGHSHEQDAAVIGSRSADRAGSNTMAVIVTTISAAPEGALSGSDRLHRPALEFSPPESARYSSPLRI